VTRVRAALLAAEGDLDGAAEGYQAAAARWAERSGELELARILAGWATVERRRGRPELAGELSGRATITVDRAGVGRLLLGPAELVTAGPGDGSAAADHGGEPGWRVILITDVVGSTRISQELGDVAYLELVLAHHGLVRRQLHRFGGVEFSESGDGLLAWFGTAAHAVQAALAIQEDLAAPTGPASGLQVRIGLAAGVPLFHNTRPYGLVLNRAARIVAEAGPGEVLVDEAVAAHLPAAAVAVDLREINLRGIGNHLLATVQPAG
jgi:class 3 adenylate cyclase